MTSRNKFPSEMTIGEVAEIAGIATSALRYYEDIDLIKPHRRVNGQRRYLPDVLPLLVMIQMAKDCHFTLDEIKELVHGFPADVPISERWQIIAVRKIKHVDAMIAAAQETKRLLEESLDCQYLHFELDEDIQISE